jgi:transcriptional regulator GlxA family with amidase domain
VNRPTAAPGPAIGDAGGAGRRPGHRRERVASGRRRAVARDRAIDTLLVPGGGGAREVARDEEFLGWLRRAAGCSARVASVCTGSFPLAAAGLLDGLAATTHWRYAPELARSHRAVDVRTDPIYLRQAAIWTSAGVPAGIDLALALVEADHGVEVAQRIARELVVFLRRPGGRSQFAGPVWSPPAPQPAVRAAQDLIHGTRALGAPPGDYVEQVRVDTARRVLESEPALVSVVATRAGFGSAETMRPAFLRRLGVGPDDYRQRFARDAPPAAPEERNRPCRSPSRRIHA